VRGGEGLLASVLVGDAGDGGRGAGIVEDGEDVVGDVLVDDGSLPELDGELVLLEAGDEVVAQEAVHERAGPRGLRVDVVVVARLVLRHDGEEMDAFGAIAWIYFEK